MLQKLEKKQACLTIAAVLVLVVFWTFVFSIAEITCDFEMKGNKPSSNGTYGSVNRIIDWLTVEIKTAGRTGRASFSPLRNVLRRELVFLEKFYAIKNLTLLFAQSANPDHFLNNKDAIQLKLRI